MSLREFVASAVYRPRRVDAEPVDVRELPPWPNASEMWPDDDELDVLFGRPATDGAAAAPAVPAADMW